MALPAYESALSAYHEAFADEIRRMVAVLPLPDNARAVDAGSGDGFFAGLLADRLGEAGSLVCVDSSTDYLNAAKSHLRGHPRAARISFTRADVARLPFPDGPFDLVWCAQSFYSFPSPLAALREFARVLSPTGTLAILENDSANHILLPWPPDVDVRLQAAELAALRARHARADKYYIGRGLTGVFEAAGMKAEKKRTFAWDRLAPFDAPTRRFLALHVAALRERVRPFLGSADAALCEPWLDPSSDRFILDGRAASATVIDHLVWGRRAL